MTGRADTGSLKNFLQSGTKTLVELVDGGGHSSKLVAVERSSSTAYLVMNSKNLVILIAAAFTDKAGEHHAVVFADSGEKEEALSILHRRFLTGIANATDPYRKWAEQKAVFTYGSVQDTRMIGLRAGALGTANIRSDGTGIIAEIGHFPCHCGEAFACQGIPSTVIDCINKSCDFINCVVDFLNRETLDCSSEQSDMNVSCWLAAAGPID